MRVTMSLRRWALVLCVVFATLVGPGSAWAGAQVTATRPAKATKACSLVTPAEVQQVLGEKVGSGKKGGSSLPARATSATGCDWLIPHGGGAGVSLVVVRYRTTTAARRGYERRVHEFATADPARPTSTVPGIGAAATFFAPYDRGDGAVSPSDLLAVDGKAVLQANLLPPYDPLTDDPATLVADYQQLMGFALPRL